MEKEAERRWREMVKEQMEEEEEKMDELGGVEES